MGILKMAGFCVNYLKILCLTGFLLMGVFAILIKIEVEAMRVEKERINSGFWMSLITSIIYLVGFIFFTIKIKREENEEDNKEKIKYMNVNLQDNLISERRLQENLISERRPINDIE